jgi:hypothetical protein
MPVRKAGCRLVCIITYADADFRHDRSLESNTLQLRFQWHNPRVKARWPIEAVAMRLTTQVIRESLAQPARASVPWGEREKRL